MNRSRVFAILAAVFVIAVLWFIFFATGGPEVVQEGDVVSEDAGENGATSSASTENGEED
jgi:hypothetical protein